VEHADRLEVTHVDGRVAFCPGPLERFPAEAWEADGDGRMRPSGPPRLRIRGSLDGTGVGLQRVLWLKGTGATCTWHTDRGEVPASGPASRASRAHPGLVRLGKGLYVHLSRVRAVEACFVSSARLSFDEGTTLVTSRNVSKEFLTALGAVNVSQLPWSDTARFMLREGLRDYDFDLAQAPRRVLRRSFGEDARRLIANVIWQTARYRALGLDKHRGDGHRAFWYVPLKLVLTRAGLLHPRVQDEVYLEYERVMADLVGSYRLFTYRELGFVDPRPRDRRVGSRLPQVVVVAEKGSLEPGLERLREARGVTTVTLGGQSTYIVAEYLVESLRAAGVQGPVLVLGYVDFDPFGWHVVSGFVKHLGRYGMEVKATGYLVRPHRFTSQERESMAMPVEPTNALVRGMIRQWITEGGGIQGQGLGLYADALDADRVLAALDEELAGMPA